MAAIFKRETKSYYTGMVGYVTAAVSLFFLGLYFTNRNLMYASSDFASVLYTTTLIMLFLLPAISMRSFAEDRRNKTDQLLLTSPVSVAKMVLGKYFAMLTVLALPCLLFCLCPLIIKLNGTATLAVDYATLLMFFLLGSVCIAVGLLVSSLTESQVIAAIGTFGAVLFLLLWNSLVSYIPSSAAASLVGFLLLAVLLGVVIHALTGNYLLSGIVTAVAAAAEVIVYLVQRSRFDDLLPTLLDKFSVTEAFSNFASYHLFDFTGLILYLSLDFLLVFITVQLIQRRRYC